MKINTRLKLAVLVPIIMALVISLAFYFSYRTMEAAQKNGDTVRQIRNSISNLNNFAHSYILYHEERPKQQFLAEHNSMGQLIASVQLRNQDQQRLVDRVRLSSESMKDIFLGLVSNYESAGSTGSDELRSEVEEALVGQFLVRAIEVDADASLLRNLVDNDLGNVRTTTFVLVFAVLILATAPLTVVLLRTRRSITSSLSNLGKGAAVIGSGDLDYRIEAKGDDEIGDLSRAFNRMAADLKTVTASKGDLEREIDERKKAEEALKRSHAELEAVNRELEAFSYSVSHDLRAPLRSMEGFSRALIEDYAEKLDEQGKKYLRYIQESSDLMARLIDDLLKLSRVTRSDINFDRVNLSEMARNVVAEFEKAEPQRKAEVAIASDITAYGDRSLLRLVVENLLGNAWKFSSNAGSPRIEMGAVEHNGRQAYFVRDNGVGFDMIYADKLFKPFQRLHKASEYAGTGIGLATVQRIIRRHGGEVWAESKVGEGATFYFTLGWRKGGNCER